MSIYPEKKPARKRREVEIPLSHFAARNESLFRPSDEEDAGQKNLTSRGALSQKATLQRALTSGVLIFKTQSILTRCAIGSARLHHHQEMILLPFKSTPIPLPTEQKAQTKCYEGAA